MKKLIAQRPKPTLPKQPLPELTLLDRLPELMVSFVDQDIIRALQTDIATAKEEGWLHDLHSRLKAFSETTTDWFSQIWYNRIYDSFKGPLRSLCYSIGLPCLSETHSANTQLAAMILGLYEEHQTYQSGHIPSPKRGKQDICDAQYPYFSVSRTPTPTGTPDDIATYPESKHIIVMCHGHAFRVDLKTDLDERKSIQELEIELDLIRKQTHTKPGLVGNISSGDRQTCANLRKKLDHNDTKTIRQIDTSLFIVCLDDESTSSPAFESLFSANRWYEKHQLVQSKTGEMSFVNEHSRHFGTVATERTLRACEHAKKYLNEGKKSEIAPEQPQVKPLHLSEANNTELEQIQKRHLEATSEFRVSTQRSSVSKETIKSMQLMKPDTFIQLVFNLAMRMLKKNGSVYEAICLRQYESGLTGVARTNVSEVDILCDAILNEKTVTKDIITSAAAAIDRQKDEALKGNTPERLLVCLSHFLKPDDPFREKAKALFSHTAITALKTDIMSTSNLNGVTHFGFEPPNPEGYGIGYSLDDYITFTISQYASAPSLGPELETAIKKLLEICHCATP